MNYEEARVYLDGIAKYGSVLGLENIRALLSELGNPQDGLKFVHVAGTNGKGSTLAFLSTILSEAGYKVGRYVSPTIETYRERIQVDGEPIPKDALALGVALIKEAADAMEARGLSSPTVFEAETALAFWYFARQKCDIVVLEAGLGGERDATNVIKTTEVAAFSSISLDHMDVLGGTVGEIAADKAGIVKDGCTVVTVRQCDAAMKAVTAAAVRHHCPLVIADAKRAGVSRMEFGDTVFSYEGMKDVSISLSGTHQVENAVLAIECAYALYERGYRIKDAHIRAGLSRARWDGRLTPIGERPLFLVDGAHNAGAAARLAESLEHYFPGRRLIFIIGVFADKEYGRMLGLTAPLAEKIVTVSTPGNARALPAEILKAEAEKYCDDVTAAGTLAEAAKEALAAAGFDDVIVAFGSLSYLGELTRIVKGENNG